MEGIISAPLCSRTIIFKYQSQVLHYIIEGRPTDWSNKHQDSMDRILEQYEIQSIRNTMLKHEEIFRNQVQELHHLYRVQKMLMAELRSKGLKLHPLNNATLSTMTDAPTRLWSNTSISETSHSSHDSIIMHHSTAQQNTEHGSTHQYGTRRNTSLKEINIYSEDPCGVQKGFDLEQPAEEYNSTATKKQTTTPGKHLERERSTEGPHNWTDDENDIELTLSIGCVTEKK